MAQLGLKTLRRVTFFLFLLVVTAIVLRWISLEKWRRELSETPTEEPTPKPQPSPTASRAPVITGKLDTAKLFSGITVHATVEPTPGSDATTERNDPQSYVLELKLHARVPEPNKSLDDLAKVNAQLPHVLPGLSTMITPESVSPLFKDLYETKLKELRDNLLHLEQLLSRHNFYDTQTVLNLRHPKTNRRAVLLQADMDVDADGSDADRLPAGSGVSPNFKPFTSYKWGKKTPAANPYLAPTEERLKKLQGDLNSAPNADRKRDLNNAIKVARDEIETMKKFSFFIGAADPYIVIPGVFVHNDGGKVGDYAVVVFEDRLFPAIVGDVGPNDKTGEASLRIAKEINPKADPMNRPVNDLKVTYLIFPGTAEQPFGPPDYDKLSARCEKLVEEIGGAGVPMHHWTNILPTPTPTPIPSPTASATPSSTPTPATTATPSPSPSNTAPPSASPGSSPAPTFAFPTGTPKP